MAQLNLASRVNFQMTPSELNWNSLVRKMYQPQQRRGILYPRSPYALGLLARYNRAQLQGLGFDYYDLLAQAGLQDCDPKDVQCVAANQQKQAAVEDLWVSQYESNPATANAPTPTVDVTANTSPQAIAAFQANQPDNEATIQVNSGPVYSDTQLEQGIRPLPAVTAPPPPPAPPKPNQSVPPTTPLTPMSTGIPNTAQAYAQSLQPSAGGGAALPPSTQACQFWQSPSTTTPGACDTNNTILIGGAIAVGLLLFLMGGRR